MCLVTITDVPPLDLAEAVIAASYDVTVLLDAQGTVRWTSGGTEALLGRTIHDLVGRRMLDLLRAEDVERASLAVARMIADVNMVRVEVGALHANGSVVLVEITGSSQLTNPSVGGFVLHLRRTMGRVGSNNEDPSFEHLLHVVLEHSGDDVLACDQDGLIHLCSRTMGDLLGWPLGIGTPSVWPVDTVLRDLSGMRIAPSALPHLRCLAGHGVDAEYLLDSPSGQRRLRTTAHPLLNHAGRRRGAVVIFRDVTEQVAHEASLLHRATHDPLTGLLGRGALRAELATALERCGAEGLIGSILFVDIDHLKIVNDTLGHGAGDAVLIEVARRLLLDRKPTDIVARFAGDEFVVFAAVVDADHAGAVASAVTSRLRQPFNIEDRTVYPTASIGVAVGNAGQDVDILLRSADLSANQAKRHGRNRWELADVDRLSSSLHRLDGFGWVRRAIDDQRFDSVIQPVFDRAGTVVGGEILARGYDLDGRLLPPDEFIPLAEEGGLIDVIDRASFERALALIASLPVRAPMRISCNVSPQFLSTADFASTVIAAVDRSGIDATCLALELTERSFIDAGPETQATLLALSERGVSLGIDDFGTMYSTIGLLRNFPFSFLKIDRSFVEWTPHSSRDSTLVRCIVDLAHTLGMTVVAEGVQHEDQRSFLLNIGCDYLQGMLLSPPVPIEQFCLGSMVTSR